MRERGRSSPRRCNDNQKDPFSVSVSSFHFLMTFIRQEWAAVGGTVWNRISLLLLKCLELSRELFIYSFSLSFWWYLFSMSCSSLFLNIVLMNGRRGWDKIFTPKKYEMILKEGKILIKEWKRIAVNQRAVMSRGNIQMNSGRFNF